VIGEIRDLRAWEILDSRGRPTLAARVSLAGGITSTAHAPAGASTGRHEAHELRDADPRRHAGLGVLNAVRNVEHVIGPALHGVDAGDQARVDRTIIQLDGSPDKSRLGANAILAVSCAVARAAALAAGVPLWKHLAGARKPALPVPMVNIISGGLHAGRLMEFQDFLATPLEFPTMAETLDAVAAVHRAAREILELRGCAPTGVADEGGWGPALESNEMALEVLTSAIERAGYRPGEQMAIAIDVAASHFHQNGVYRLRSESRALAAAGLTDLMEAWCGRYPVLSVEDILDEDDWDGWTEATRRLGGRVQLIGDDLFATNAARLERGIHAGAANAVLVKMNQAGTLTETFEVIDLAKRHGWRAVISARSGETEDSFLADLAVASGAGQIKIGSITRSERLAKYNRLLEIEQFEFSRV